MVIHIPRFPVTIQLQTSKFPTHNTYPGLVYRIVDMFLTEGPDTLYKVAVSLLKLSRNDLISQDFEGTNI